jgi:hypothetical protein
LTPLSGRSSVRNRYSRENTDPNQLGSGSPRTRGHWAKCHSLERVQAIPYIEGRDAARWNWPSGTCLICSTGRRKHVGLCPPRRCSSSR